MSATLVKFVIKLTLYCNGKGSTLTIPNNLIKKKICHNKTDQLRMETKLPSEISLTVEILSAGTQVMREYWIIKYFRLSGSILT
jgi:hypothetical protein